MIWAGRRASRPGGRERDVDESQRVTCFKYLEACLPHGVADWLTVQKPTQGRFRKAFGKRWEDGHLGTDYT
jgi:hypothetical protein